MNPEDKLNKIKNKYALNENYTNKHISDLKHHIYQLHKTLDIIDKQGIFSDGIMSWKGDILIQHVNAASESLNALEDLLKK